MCFYNRLWNFTKFCFGYCSLGPLSPGHPRKTPQRYRLVLLASRVTGKFETILHHFITKYWWQRYRYNRSIFFIFWLFLHQQKCWPLRSEQSYLTRVSVYSAAQLCLALCTRGPFWPGLSVQEMFRQGHWSWGLFPSLGDLPHPASSLSLFRLLRQAGCFITVCVLLSPFVDTVSHRVGVGSRT